MEGEEFKLKTTEEILPDLPVILDRIMDTQEREVKYATDVGEALRALSDAVADAFDLHRRRMDQLEKELMTWKTPSLN